MTASRQGVANDGTSVDVSAPSSGTSAGTTATVGPAEGGFAHVGLGGGGDLRARLRHVGLGGGGDLRARLRHVVFGAPSGGGWDFWTGSGIGGTGRGGGQ
ncbi:MAG TPA: hypothetical protein VGV93_12360 [Acidimicrobiales bacterium]|nr:hypothetical protein [Acidimicrobiales bacterium]